MHKDDCEAMIRLMNNGFSMKDAMHLLEETKNHECFEEIRERLSEGESLSDFFYLYCPREYRGYFSGFIRYMSFSDSLSSSFRIVEQEETQKKELIHGLFYPLMLFAGMLIGVWVFNQYVLPNMISLMAGFQIEGGSYVLIQRIIQYVSAGGIIALFLIVLMTVYSLQKSRIVSTYRRIYPMKPQSLLVQYASAEFVRFYLECERRKVPTIEAMKIIGTLKEKPLAAYIAAGLDHNLNEGISMKEAVTSASVEKALIRFFRIALYASDCTDMLEGYLEMVHVRTLNRIKRLSAAIQLVSYSAVGLVLIFVYQVLMMPMSMLQNI